MPKLSCFSPRNPDADPGFSKVDADQIAHILNDQPELTMSRKERRTMLRIAKKRKDAACVHFLENYSDQLKANNGSKAKIQVIQPRTLDRIEEEVPSYKEHVLHSTLLWRNEAARLLQKKINEDNAALVELAEENVAATEKLNESETEKSLMSQQIHQLRKECNRIRQNQADEDDVALSKLTLDIFADLGTKPTVTECLKLIERLAPETVSILPDAWESAVEADEHFRDTPRLLKLLSRLVTCWRSTLIEKGDAEARKVFSTSEYAAGESKLVERSSFGEAFERLPPSAHRRCQ